MSGFFCFQRPTYHENVVRVKVRLRDTTTYRDTAVEALRKQKALENRLPKDKVQRKEEAKGSVIAVARKLTNVASQLGKQIQINLEGIGSQQTNHGITSPYFEQIYLANEERLSAQFNHITTDDLNRVKENLIVSLQQFNRAILENKDSPFYKKLIKEQKLAACREVIEQTIIMIACAKTLSAVFATLIAEADLLERRLDIAEDLSKGEEVINFLSNPLTTIRNPQAIIINSTADLFAENLPAKLHNALTRASWGSHLNTVGSAFQLEQAREMLISRLEAYLAKRARLKTFEEKNGELVYECAPMNKGIFFNKALQEARIQVAVTLLAELKGMQLNDMGGSINTPQHFAAALNNAIEKNNKFYKELARELPGVGLVDDVGELSVMLDDMRQDMKVIYPKDVHTGSNISLYEQLNLTTSPTATATIQQGLQ